MWKVLTHVFGSRNQRLIKELSRTVAAVNGFEAAMRALEDGQFPEKTRELKARHAAGTPLDAHPAPAPAPVQSLPHTD